MKKTVTVVVLICMLGLVLSGCNNSSVSFGTYLNENNAGEQVVITQNSIRFVNVSFNGFNDELRRDMEADLRLTDFLSGENAYTFKDGVLSVDIGAAIAVSFKCGKGHIIVNGEKFNLR